MEFMILLAEENEFVHHVLDELETYQKKNWRESVLLFPCLPSRLRYLIHKTIEDVPELTTFSVGESWRRRVVVCHSDLRNELKEDSDLESNNTTSEDSLRTREQIDYVTKPKSLIPSRSRGPKRPDKPLYMPRAARERLSQQHLKGPTLCEESPISAPSNCSCGSNTADAFCHKTTKNIQESEQESLSSVVENSENTSVCCSAKGKQKLLPAEYEDKHVVWDQTVSGFSDMTLGDPVTEEEGCVSVPYINSCQTEDKNTDVDEVTEEIKAHLKDTVSFSIEHVHKDYSLYENVSINPDDFGHVIEIYDFPSFFKTEDLLDAFSDFSDGGMKIKWVDNTHALGVFSSESAALNALSISHPLLKTRTLAEGSKKAKGKAVRRAEFIQPVKERPRTDSAVARRMVTRALGLQGRGRALRF
uniref:R3H domain and coiled-coil containing 1 n=1 Tax=Cynoglossus semilaevis TaxID=244447 RepID=A0A3P8V704_CYNSE